VSIWKNRCKWVFDKLPFSVAMVKVMAAVMSTYSVGARYNAVVSPDILSAQEAWKAPGPSVVKLNVDGSIGQLRSSSWERLDRTSTGCGGSECELH